MVSLEETDVFVPKIALLVHSPKRGSGDRSKGVSNKSLACAVVVLVESNRGHKSLDPETGLALIDQIYVGNKAQYEACKNLVAQQPATPGPIQFEAYAPGGNVAVKEFYAWAPFDEF
jgi:hypothetical protein